MVERFHSLAKQVFGKASVDDLELSEIDDFTARYPYFAPAQFLLVQKLRQLDSPDYGKQLQRAVLYYNDPLAFDYFINNKWAELEEFEKEFFDDQTSPVQNEEMPLPSPGPPVMVNSEPEENMQAGVSVSSPEEALPAQDSEGSELAFEPYHTVDYFASQGIKLSQEDQPKDRFGKQLKSFTEWLKTMKRLPGQQTVKLEQQSDTRVEHMAETSVVGPEVVTESMAEVWLKQGNTEKAIEVYEKLGLNNPSKSAYFASLIENLKNA